MIRKIPAIWFLAFFTVAATLPFWLLGDDYFLGIAVRAFMVAALAVSWNIFCGFGGRLSFGHAAFFGIGAYTSTLLLIHAGISPWIGGVIGMILAGIVALFLGSFSLHLQGIYFTLVTFVFALILLTLSRYFLDITGGDVGLSLPLSEPSLAMIQFRGQMGYYYLALGLLSVYVSISAIVSRSVFGYRLRAIRDDEEVAQALGVATTKVKLQGFVLSAMMVAFAGTLMAQHDLFIDPGSAFGIDRSVEMALAAIFGGIGTVVGPIIGGLAIVGISEWANNALQDLVTGADVLVYGAILIAVALWLPGGLASIPGKISIFRRRRSASSRTNMQPGDQGSEKKAKTK